MFGSSCLRRQTREQPRSVSVHLIHVALGVSPSWLEMLGWLLFKVKIARHAEMQTFENCGRILVGTPAKQAGAQPMSVSEE